MNTHNDQQPAPIADAAHLDLTKEQVEAIDFITGPGYLSINPWLRHREPTLHAQDRVERAIELLDSVFEAAPRTWGEAEVRRRVHEADKLFGAVGSMVGGVFRDAAYVSTTLGYALGGMVLLIHPNTAEMTIRIPEGARAFMPGECGRRGHGEMEVLLPRGSEFRVLRDYEDEHGTRRLEMELIV